ncbi:MAG: hypothetical protein ACRDQB_08785, partial [Thermocrispum sp.]
MPEVETPPPATRPASPRLRGDLVAVGLALVLVVAAIIVGVWFADNGMQEKLWTAAPPLFGRWGAHIGPGSIAAVLLAVAVVAWGPGLAARMTWRAALVASYAAAVGWTFSLAMIDGFERGFAGRLTGWSEYLSEVPGITDTGLMLREFADRILAGTPDNWTVHVSGHPPGATLVFVWLDRIGLSGGPAASALCVLAGGLVAVAVPVAVRALAGKDVARRVLPFAVLFPGAVWLGVSADGLFAGVAATGVALLALACEASRGRRLVLAAGSGLVLGFAVFLSYGLVLLGMLALAVVVYRRAWDVLAAAVAAALAVVGVYALAGFWWFEGYQLVVQRYYQGLGTTREYGYWVWANLAAQVLVVGPAVIVGLRRCWPLPPWRQGDVAAVPWRQGDVAAVPWRQGDVAAVPW